MGRVSLGVSFTLGEDKSPPRFLLQQGMVTTAGCVVAHGVHLKGPRANLVSR